MPLILGELTGQEQVEGDYISLAETLQPCEVCWLHYDEEAFRSKTVADLLSLYSKRVLELRKDKANSSLAVVGSSFSCEVSHAFAKKLKEEGVTDVRLILFGNDVPRSSSHFGLANEDAWLGGLAEVILLTASTAWAENERRRLRGLSLELSEEDLDDMQMRLFWEQGRRPGRLLDMGPIKFQELIRRAAKQVDQLHKLSLEGPVIEHTSAAFDGETTLILQRKTASKLHIN